MRTRSGDSTNRTLPYYVAAAVVALVVVVLLSTFSVELGIVRPGANARRVVVAVAEIETTLGPDASFIEFSEALRAAQAARRSLAVRNAADNRVGHAVDRALDCYAAVRDVWQTELVSDWNEAVHGDPAYWRSYHPALDLSGADGLAPAALRDAMAAEALRHAREALAIVER